MPDEEKRMTFWEHLEELRWTFFRILLVLLVATGFGLFFVNEILEILTYPLNELMLKSTVRLNQAGPFDAVLLKMKVGLLAGIVGGLPFIIILIWSFISPGLKNAERKSFWWIFSSISLLFTAGVILGFYALTFMMPVLVSFSVAGADNLWRLREYIDFVFFWLLGAGVLFQLPLVIFALVRLGIVELKTLREKRAYAILASFIVAAVVTPSPDAVTQIIVGVPLVLLYEIGIFISSFQKKKGLEII